MTANQIAYWNLQETKRSNQVKEGISQGTLDETKRSNVARETETNRSNVARETETARSNKAKEALTADIQDAQKKRWEHQNSLDDARTVHESMKTMTDVLSGGIGIGSKWASIY